MKKGINATTTKDIATRAKVVKARSTATSSKEEMAWHLLHQSRR